MNIIPIDWFKSIFDNLISFIFGLAMTVIGFFVPIKNIVHLVLFFFLLDVLFGYWAAAKLRGERFSVKIIWCHTMPRLTISIVVILSAYMWDVTFQQEFVSSYKVIGWFIAGVLLFSIAENGYQITKWKVFNQIGSIVNSKIEMQTNEKTEPINDQPQ